MLKDFPDELIKVVNCLCAGENVNICLESRPLCLQNVLLLPHFSHKYGNIGVLYIYNLLYLSIYCARARVYVCVCVRVCAHVRVCVAAQRAMERKILNLKLQDKNTLLRAIRKRTKTIDIIECIMKQMWKCSTHIVRMKDNRWTKRCTKWLSKREKRSRVRPSRRCQDNKQGGNRLKHESNKRQWRALKECCIPQ